MSGRHLRSRRRASRRVDTLGERAAIIGRVCERISDGTTVRAALATESVNRSTLWRWLQEDAALRALFERARVAQAHALAEDVINLADGATQQTANAVRLAVDARKWYASKLVPKLFSERMEVEHAGEIEAEASHVVLYDATAGPPDLSSVPNARRTVLLLPDNGRDPEIAAKLPRARVGVAS